MRNGYVLVGFLFYAAAGFGGSDYAVEVVDFQGLYGPPLYNDPSAVLGKPATRCKNYSGDGAPADPNFRVKMVEAAYYLSLDGQRVVTELYPETPYDPQSWIIVRFDHKVLDYPGNPYGQDLIVFGNSVFSHGGGNYVGDASDMNTLQLFDADAVEKGYFEQVKISVSQDGLIWYAYDPNRMDPNDIRFADALYPTQAYHWNRTGACWTDEEMDFTLPVDPNLRLEDFAELSVADAIDLYKGSGGGTPYDLRDLPDYDSLQIDPETGCRWIQYVRLEGGGLGRLGGEVDAVSDVAGCGDPTHPFPAGDLNEDCRVDLYDFLLLSQQWAYGNDTGADLEDLILLCENWLACTYRCQ